MKKIIGLLLLPLFILTIYGCTNHNNLKHVQNGIKTYAIIEGDDFYIYQNKTFKKHFIKGVNIGATKPGYFPGELGITKSDYLRWFEYIKDMHANTIRVYTTMMPAFYEALYEHNLKHEDKLYLMQGVWLNEDLIAEYLDPYQNDNHLLNEFIKDGKDLVDIFHGNKTLAPRLGFASGTYDKDISPYVIAWVLGVEWDPMFVSNTNQLHADKNSFDGQFLYTKNASPFEVFLAKVGDAILTYEKDIYKTTRPLSYTNWVTTDPLEHPYEPDVKEDLVSVDVENIRLKKQAFAGQFASYHVYPYYPELFNYSEDLIHKYEPVNTYKAYLDKLKAYHTYPVLIAEFGLPSSRGKAHDARFSGFNQGRLTEQEQGEMLAHMIQDIKDVEILGALIFAFQDEWFKRTWNTMDFDLAWQRPYWSNVETNEQMFGLLAFEPGETLKVKLDGDKSDWQHIDYVVDDTFKLKATIDERYLYLLVEYDAIYKNEPIYIPIDTLANQGNFGDKNKSINFSQAADFLITIGETSRIEVDPYYDAFSHLYGTLLNMVEKPAFYNQKNSQTFTRMYHALSRSLTIPITNQTFPFSQYEAGLLVSGISDPDDPRYYSLSDYYRTDTFIEIRIPYLLLNIMDPSQKALMSDFQGQQSFTHQPFEQISFGVTIENGYANMRPFTYQNWDMPTYHERLKQSYYVVQDIFKSIGD